MKRCDSHGVFRGDFRMADRKNRKILRGYKAIENKTGKGRVQTWRDVRDGLFPAPIELGPNSVGWYEDEVDDWLASRPRRTYGAPAQDEPAAAA